jgi:hypothetical protein
LAGFVTQRVVANKRFIGLLLDISSGNFRLAEHRQGVGIDGRLRRGANRAANDYNAKHERNGFKTEQRSHSNDRLWVTHNHCFSD